MRERDDYSLLGAERQSELTVDSRLGIPKEEDDLRGGRSTSRDGRVGRVVLLEGGEEGSIEDDGSDAVHKVEAQHTGERREGTRRSSRREQCRRRGRSEQERDSLWRRLLSVSIPAKLEHRWT
jgi:hypothetical protein